jgi:hypothetical protein
MVGQQGVLSWFLLASCTVRMVDLFLREVLCQPKIRAPKIRAIGVRVTVERLEA